MRRRTAMIMAGLIVITAIVVFIIDSKLYYHGKNDFGLHKELPFKIVPQYWGYDMGMLDFVLVQSGETVVAKGMTYWDNPNIKVNEILKYGFNKEKLIALVNDSLSKEYYIVCQKQTDAHSKQELKITVVPKQNFISDEQFKWIEIKNASMGRMEEARNYLEILLILMFLIITYNLSVASRLN